MTNTTKTATNRRGNEMTAGEALMKEAQLSADIRKMLKRMLNNHGIYSRRELVGAIAITALTTTVLALLVWVWYFAVS